MSNGKSSEELADQLNKLVELEGDRAAQLAKLAAAEEPNGRPASLLRALISAYGYDYFVGVCVKFLYDGAQFVGPLLLQLVITFLSARQAANEADDDEIFGGQGLIGTPNNGGQSAMKWGSRAKSLDKRHAGGKIAFPS